MFPDSNVLNEFSFIFLVRLESDFRLPFDTNNLFGYLIACVVQYIFTFNHALSAMALIAIADGSRLILTAMAEDMESNLNTPSEDENEHESESETEMIQRFNELIQFHSDAKQFSEFQFLFQI